MKVLALTGRVRALTLGAGIALAAFLSACGDSPADTTTPVTAPSFTLSGSVAKVVVTPSTASLLLGGKTTLVATAYDASGNVVTGGTFDWSSKNNAVATVSAGAVTAVAAGTATINASLGGFGGNATITVTAPVSTATAASVTVSPTSASVAAGSTLQLAATAKDASGNVLTGRPTTWSSSAPGIATVSSTGVVTGVAVGSATVTVTVDSKTTTSAITVTTATTSTPPPTAVGVMFADGFEPSYAPKQNNAGWMSTTATNVMVSTDVAHSGTHSMRFSFPGKANCNDASAQQRFTLGKQMKEVWVEYYVYFPKGGEGGSAPYYHRVETGCSDTSDNNKFFTLYGPQYAGETTMSLQTWTSKTLAGTGSSRVNTAYSKAGRNGIWFYSANSDPFVSTAADLGKWIQIRIHARLATFGQTNGLIQVYRNGTLILSNTTLDWYDSTNTANYLTQGYLMGWSNSGFTQMTNIYVDDFKIIDTYPGW